MASCGLVNIYWRFGTTSCLHLQGISGTRRVDFLYLEDESSNLVRKVRKFTSRHDVISQDSNNHRPSCGSFSSRTFIALCYCSSQIRKFGKILNLLTILLTSSSSPPSSVHSQYTVRANAHRLTLRRRIKSHLLFAGIIRSSPFSPR